MATGRSSAIKSHRARDRCPGHADRASVLVIGLNAADERQVSRLSTGLRLRTKISGGQLDLQSTSRRCLPRLLVVGHDEGRFNGLEVLVAAQYLAPSVPVVIYARNGNEDIAVRAIKAGAALYLPAPSDDPELNEALRTALRWKGQLPASAPGGDLSWILDWLDIGTYRADAEWKVLAASPAMARILGYRSAGALVRAQKRLAWSVDEEATDGSAAASMHSPLRRLFRKDLTSIIVEGAARRVDDEHGHVLGYEGYLRDVTELQNARAQAAYQSMLLDQVQHAVIGSDEQFAVTYWSRGAERLLGLTTPEVIGRDVAFVLADEVRDAISTAAAVSLLGRGAWEGEVICQHRDGRRIETYCQASRLDIDGTFAGFVGVLVDVTERKRHETKLRETLAECERLLSDAHRRVNSNLQLVSSLVSTQLSRSGAPPLRQLAQELQNRIRTIALLHEWLLQTPQKTTVDMRQYLSGIARHLCRTYASQADVRVACEVDPIGLEVEQATRIGLIVNELASNALKHAFVGRPSGTIVVRLTGRPDSAIELEVRDTGVGLPAGFNMQSTQRLGLRLVMELTTRMGASVRINREGGTHFRVQFPATT